MPRKRYSADIKAKVALEAIRGQKTTNGRSRTAFSYFKALIWTFLGYLLKAKYLHETL